MTYKRNTTTMKIKRAICKSGLTGWQARVRDNWSSLEELKGYDENYDIAGRLGYESAEELWDENPIVQGSTNPSDLCVVLTGDNQVPALEQEVQELFRKFMYKKIDLNTLLSKLKALDNKLHKQFGGKDKSIWFRLFKGDTGATTIGDIEATLNRKRGFGNEGHMLDAIEIGINHEMGVYYS